MSNGKLDELGRMCYHLAQETRKEANDVQVQKRTSQVQMSRQLTALQPALPFAIHHHKP
jgi:hypothetical protein